MKCKNIDFYQVYDICVVWVLVLDICDCYVVLGVVYNIWQYIFWEFDDYIVMFKENGYCLLYMAVLGLDGKVLEVQICIYDMYDEVELGVCVYWCYKEGSIGKFGSYDDKIVWLCQVLEWQEELGDSVVSSVFLEFSEDIVDEWVYIFILEGYVVDLV